MVIVIMICIFVLAVIIFASAQIIRIVVEDRRKRPYGIILIEKERKEQIEKHGISIRFDVLNNEDESLKHMAISFLLNDVNFYPSDNCDIAFFHKVSAKSHKERLIIAGALIAAELDRLDAIMNDEI